MTSTNRSGGFSAEETAAMKARAAELRARKGGSDGEADVLAAIDEMPEGDKALATHVHRLVHEVAPDLRARTWYGMPAYATPGTRGKVVCFFQSAGKMGTRYNVLGFSDSARLDDGAVWPTSFALLSWDAAVEEQLRELLSRAVS